jgi:peroxiredoxin
MPEHRLRGVLGNAAHGVSVGQAAPDFELPALIAGVRQPLRLSAYRGQKSVVLAFYPFNWQPTTAAQLIGYQRQRAQVLASNAETIAITVDSIMNSAAWEREIGPFDFPMCSDFWPQGEVCERYGVLRKSGEDAGASERAVVVVDRSGSVAFRKDYSDGQSASLEDLLALLGQI